MPEPVATAQVTTEPAKTSSDNKNSDTLLSTAAKAAPAVAPETKVDPSAVKTGAATEPAKAGEVKAEGDKVEGAPEKYDFKAPEGVTLDSEAVTELSTVAKELNLSNDNAQKFVDLASKHTTKVQTQMAEAQAKAWTDARAGWVAQLKADKEVGGANFDTTREQALRAVRFVGIPELKEVFDSGWGDHPALVKAFAKFGKAMSEDKLVDGDVTHAPKSAAEIIYGKK